MDFNEHVRKQAQHLARMGSMPMARDHAKLREQQLIASDPMYAVLPELVREELQRLRSQPKVQPEVAPSQRQSPCEPAAARTTASTGRRKRAG